MFGVGGVVFLGLDFIATCRVVLEQRGPSAGGGSLELCRDEGCAVRDAALPDRTVNTGRVVLEQGSRA